MRGGCSSDHLSDVAKGRERRRSSPPKTPPPPPEGWGPASSAEERVEASAFRRGRVWRLVRVSKIREVEGILIRSGGGGRSRRNFHVTINLSKSQTGGTKGHVCPSASILTPLRAGNVHVFISARALLVPFDRQKQPESVFVRAGVAAGFKGTVVGFTHKLLYKKLQGRFQGGNDRTQLSNFKIDSTRLFDGGGAGNNDTPTYFNPQQRVCTRRHRSRRGL